MCLKIGNLSRHEIAVAALLLLLLCFSPLCRGDHPDRAHRPRGRAEVMLSGVDIDSKGHHSIRNEDGISIEPIREVLRTLGPPTLIKPTDSGCEKEYVWKRPGIRLEIDGGCIFQKVHGRDVNRGHGAYSIEVWGRRPSGKMGRTGRGLALGDSLTKMRRLYGTRCECGPYLTGTGSQDTHGLHYGYNAFYQWDSGVSLSIDLNRHHRVVHMLLDGAIE